MTMLVFAALTLLVLAGAAAAVWLKSPRQAAYGLLLAILSGAGMVAWLHSEFLALALVLILGGGAAFFLLMGLPALERLAPLAQARPDEDRSFWAGIVAVLFFVITYRVLATAPWGTEDRSAFALTDAQRGLEAIRTLGATLSGEFVLALLMAAVLAGVAIAVAFALVPRESDA